MRQGGASALGPPRQTADMEQAPPDSERQWQPAPLEPLGHPDAGLQAAVGEEAEGSRDEGPGDGTVRRRGSRGRGAWCLGLAGRAGLGWRGPGVSAGEAPLCSDAEGRATGAVMGRRASWGCGTKGRAKKATAAAAVRGAEEMCGCGPGGMEVGARNPPGWSRCGVQRSEDLEVWT